MSQPPPNEPSDERPELPGLASWRAVYVVVIGFFLVVVAALAVFSRFYA